MEPHPPPRPGLAGAGLLTGDVTSRLRDEFEFLGTRDYTPWLSLPAAPAFRHKLGDERISAQVYNEPDDYRRLAELL